MPKKTYQEQMRHSYPDHPIVKPIAAGMVKTWGEGMQVLPSPLEIRAIMKSIPEGEVMTAKELCTVLAKKHQVDIACPYTTGILMNIVAHAIEEDENDETPWWRTRGKGFIMKFGYVLIYVDDVLGTLAFYRYGKV